MIGSQLWRDEGDGALSLADCRNMNSGGTIGQRRFVTGNHGRSSCGRNRVVMSLWYWSFSYKVLNVKVVSSRPSAF